MNYLRSELSNKDKLLIEAKVYVDRMIEFEEVQKDLKPNKDRSDVDSLKELKSNVESTMELLRNTLKAHNNLQTEFDIITRSIEGSNHNLMLRDQSHSLGTVYEEVISENGKLKEDRKFVYEIMCCYLDISRPPKVGFNVANFVQITFLFLIK